MQKPWGAIVLREFEEEPGGLWGWSRVSDAERNRRGGPEKKGEWGGLVTVGTVGDGKFLECLVRWRDVS